jgi:hypothetical protein
MQKKFDRLLLSHPHRAASLLENCKSHFKGVQRDGELASRNADTVYETLEKNVARIQKDVAEIQKVMSLLKKHSRKGEKFI